MRNVSYGGELWERRKGRAACVSDAKSAISARLIDPLSVQRPLINIKASLQYALCLSLCFLLFAYCLFASSRGIILSTIVFLVVALFVSFKVCQLSVSPIDKTLCEGTKG